MNSKTLANIIRTRLRRLALDAANNNPPLTPADWRSLIEIEADCVFEVIAELGKNR